MKNIIFDGMSHIQDLRYGENPHQKASWYGHKNSGLSDARLLQGKELSYNNLIDLEAAILTVKEFECTACVVIKHTNPCGVAFGKTVFEATKTALDCDRTSAFGGIIASNVAIDKPTAIELSKDFYECIVAPAFDSDALAVFKTKKNLRILELDIKNITFSDVNVRSILGGILVQEKDNQTTDPSEWKVVTKAKPTVEQFTDLIFAWNVCKHVHSNAIVLVENMKTVGIGAGQTNRIGSAEIAFANLNGKSSGNSTVLASDGFFPFDDIVNSAHSNSIKALIQPGGSLKDQESIDTCDRLGMSMIFTNKRHFLH